MAWIALEAWFLQWSAAHSYFHGLWLQQFFSQFVELSLPYHVAVWKDSDALLIAVMARLCSHWLLPTWLSITPHTMELSAQSPNVFPAHHQAGGHCWICAAHLKRGWIARWADARLFQVFISISIESADNRCSHFSRAGRFQGPAQAIDQAVPASIEPFMPSSEQPLVWPWLSSFRAQHVFVYFEHIGKLLGEAG